MVFLTQNTSRQREILEVVFRNGWDYMRRLLTVGKAESPELPTPTVLRNILVDLGPVYVKFGQLLSTRPDIIPADYVEALTALQANVPSVAWSRIEGVLKDQLNAPVEDIFSEFNREPVAAGSIAQTHRATLKNGQEVAVKVQRPGIDQVVEQDIALIKGVADLVSRTDFGEDYDVVALAEEFTNALRAELDFTQEAGYTDQLRSNLTNSRWFDTKQVVIPKIYWDVTTEKLMVMEWLEGCPILEADIPESQEKRRQEITTLLFRVFFQQIYLDGFFHADPHPGNIFYLQDGRIALIDCGMIGRLDPRTQQILTEMLLAVVDIDAQRCSELTLELSESAVGVNLTNLENDYDRMLRKYYNLSISQINFSEVFYEILEVSRKNNVKLPSNMGLYAKSLANLEGLARGFNPEVNLLEEVKPLMTDLFRNQIFGSNPIPTLLRTTLDLKSLSLQGPRQLELLLDRVTSETISWNLNIRELDSLRKSLDDSANRLSFSIIVAALIIGAATISANAQTPQLSLISNVLFAAASFIGFWLIVSIWRSGRLK
ncbi:AarF/ABC1/UbiB kinase family protein [Euhalothece natronophila Z-M001]|uniref:AarF/ABC1/UbiB kinase family protein n=1 Tax=Euhalothece natronophila Z-M001 TaxID=522448 RepID=A0A5B8NNS9_9CHRO|nr:AarF/ABC1/UbiB kinase family protein [Euhalothece natronophila]QDZ39850.1 AarF/ABC1/UbiB kinase family protein [Euhalothece natronophila Z-M001]